MKYSYILLTTLIFAACASENINTLESTSDTVAAPIAEKKAHEMTIHEHTRNDEYYWMNQRDAPKVLDYLNAENAYTKSKLAHTEKLQTTLFEEMKGRIKETDESVPYKENGYFYITKFEEGKEYSIHTRKKESLEAEEEMLVDANVLAEGKEFFSLAGVDVSPNNEVLSYAFDDESRRLWKIHFKNLKTGEMYSDELLNTDGGIAWANDNKTIFYAQKDTVDLRPGSIWKHTLGTSQSEDILVYEEKDNTFYAEVWRTKSNKFLVIGSTSTLTSEYQYISADEPTGEWNMFHPRERGLEYHISHFGEHFYVRTNLNALNFKLMKCSLNSTTKDSWQEVIPHRSDVLLEGMDIFSKYLVLSERSNGLSGIRIINQEDGSDHYIEFNDEAYVAYGGYNPDFDTEILRYSYTSLTTPWTTYDYNMGTKEQELMKQQEVVGGYDANNYESKRFMAKSDDGTDIPISIVYKKGLELDGTNPTVLYAYGSYGSSTDPTFNSNRISLIDRGFIWAIAHIRGGEEMGRQWYEDGKLLKKMNTFTDFNDCAEHLIAEKYTSSEKLFALGGSAGGLLMGAIINLQPELYQGVIAAVPFVDVVTTMLDEDIPLTTSEYDEWGNPNDKEYYEYMLSYSPYDQVEKKDYPNLLVTTGYHDSQVQYFEPAKWVAKLRDMKTDDNLLLFECNMDAGHGGASGRFQSLKESALEYAFFIDLAGLNK